jgi:hydroxymethylglutaryl-CoA reductase
MSTRTPDEQKSSVKAAGTAVPEAERLALPETERLALVEGLHRMSAEQRRERVRRFCGLSEQDARVLSGEIALPPDIAEHLIENVIGYFPMPLGVATNFRIDGRDLVIPMAVEETSIIAAASATAKWVRREGEIRTYTRGNLIIGQIQLPSVRNVTRAREILHDARDSLIALANACLPGLVRRGGGVREIALREIERPTHDGTMLVIHVLCDPCDAMGANLINQVTEALKPRIEALTAEKVGLCILSNLVDSKLACAEVRIRNVDPVVGKGVEEATLFAKADPYRATTHNKGVLNGIDPILIATGNDWRAVEAGVHAYASRTGRYQPITDWRVEGRDLVGRIEAPMAVGTVGGVTRLHPTAQVALRMLGAQSAEDLARICVAVGLVQNLGALKALATVGIVKGHMQLHAANLAIAAGAEIHEIAAVRERLTEVLKTEKSISLTRAKEILAAIRLARGSVIV